MTLPVSPTARPRRAAGLLALLLAGSAGCGPVHTTVRPTVEHVNGLRTVAVVVPSDGSFTVVFDRSKATAAPAIMFGLIGAAVASAHNSSLDDKKAKLLAPHLEGFSSRAAFLEGFGTTLRESAKPIEIMVVEKAPATDDARKYDALLTLTLESWGLRLPAATESDRLAPFVDVAAKMVMTKGDEVLWDEHDTVLGQGRQPFPVYQEDGSMLRTELEDTIQTAGARMAARLIYPKEGTK